MLKQRVCVCTFLFIYEKRSHYYFLRHDMTMIMIHALSLHKEAGDAFFLQASLLFSFNLLVVVFQRKKTGGVNPHKNSILCVYRDQMKI